jgi:ankyrin repeat protein
VKVKLNKKKSGHGHLESPSVQGETKSVGTSIGVVAEGETKSENESKVVSEEKEKKYTNLLFNAMRTNNLTMIGLLLAKDGLNVNRRFENGSTPLSMACFNGDAPVVELLLAADGIDVNQARTDDGCTPLYMACQNGHTHVVELLLAADGIDVNQAKTDNGCTPLLMACQEGHAHVVELLLAADGIDVNKGVQGWSPLRVAQHLNTVESLNHLQIVQLLIDAGAQ